MSCFTATKYEIIPIETYKILRNCSGCGSKTVFHNTNRVRVNANGKQLDIWLIYQCNQCKHTYNLPIHSRINRSALDKAKYEALLRNDREIVYQYGLDRILLQQNGVEIFEEPSYVLKDIGEGIGGALIRFCNPYHLRIRYDKLLSECFEISRSKAKKALETGVLSVNQLSDSEVIFHY